MKLVNYFTANARQLDKFKLEFRLLGFTFIELKFDVEINHRGSMFCLHGNKPNVEFASKALKSLYNVAGDIELSNDNLNAVLQENNIKYDD